MMTEQSKETGPLVWLDLDQPGLDAAYDQAVYAPNMQQVLGRYRSNSERVRSVLGTPRRTAYGPTADEQLDIFTTQNANAPVQIFIHGGGWRGGAAADYAHLADFFVRSGVHLIIPDFAPIATHDGDLRPMVDQLRQAVRWAYENAASFGGDPGRIYLTGHSSGAHLGGCLMTTDWAALGLPADVLTGATLASGMYDLKPVRLSRRSEYVRFTDEIEDRLSPARHIDRLVTPLIVSYGTYETPEFQRQSREFAAAIEAAGKPVTLVVAEGYNHFEILEVLPNPFGLLGRSVLEHMGLGTCDPNAVRD
jgi:arylformamidase